MGFSGLPSLRTHGIISITPTDEVAPGSHVFRCDLPADRVDGLGANPPTEISRENGTDHIIVDGWEPNAPGVPGMPPVLFGYGRKANDIPQVAGDNFQEFRVGMRDLYIGDQEIGISVNA